MTLPVFVLLGFAGWTLLTLFLTVGVYRWSRILTGRKRIVDFADYASQLSGAGGGTKRIESQDWYKRALRAHANCVENLPVYGAIVVAIIATGTTAPILDVLAVVLLCARIFHTSVHIGLAHSTIATTVRFSFFFIQVICMVWMGTYVALAAL